MSSHALRMIVRVASPRKSTLSNPIDSQVSMSNCVTILTGESSTEPLHLKITELYLDAVTDISIVAGLTNIPIERVNALSGDGTIVGNNWSGSVGVG